jgi:uncharacterized protein (TIGR04255 family)
MIPNNSPLPSFDDPPVVEVALSVQFEAVESLRTAHLGLFWAGVRSEFPVTEEHWPLEDAVERFEGAARQRIKFEIRTPGKPPVPRLWLLNQDGTELIQLQSTRFSRNWRKVGDSERYPRYENQIRPKFLSGFEAFSEFVREQRLGPLKVNQCEVTYVNHIESGKGWSAFSEMGKVFPGLAMRYSDDTMGVPEQLSASWQYVITGPDGTGVGRLHASVEPAVSTESKRDLLRATLTARAAPFDPEQPLKTLDLCREWIVRGFASITSSEMHKIWRRTDG